MGSFDISRVDDVERDPELTKRLMRSYARNPGTQASAGTILADVRANESDDLSENTVYAYGLIEIKLGGKELIDEGAAKCCKI